MEYNSRTYSVIGIEPSAFSDCVLTSITLPNSLTSIGESAFRSCTSLTSIILPNSLTSIGESAFEYCWSLTSITLPNSVTSIGEFAFDNCTSLTSITLPDSIISIRQSTFGRCKKLASITLPNSVINIDWRAFEGCSGLTSIVIPNGVTNIGENVFSECISLTSITLPNTVTSIGESAFNGCASLTFIALPDSIISIGRSAFSGCKSLTSITFPDSIKNIESETFSGCIKLESITLPSTIEAIYDGAFQNCFSLRIINFPDNLKSIGDNAFRNCSALGSIELPMELESIGSGAFSSCTRLREITVYKSLPPSIDENTFEGVDYQNCKLYAPLNSKENFSKATGWKNFTNIIEDAAFEKHLLTVTVNQGGKVAVLDEEVSNATVSWNVQTNKQVTFTFTPDDKYKISKVLLNKKDITDELSSHSYTIEKLTEDVALEVTFVEKTYAITASANEEQGIILINGEKTATKILKEGETVQFTIVPLNGYYTERVLLGEEDVTSQLINNTLQIDNLNSDLNLVITFKLFTYNATVTCNGAEGKVLINGKETESASIKKGEEVTFTVIPYKDYAIQQVMLGDKDITSQLVNGIYTLSQVTEDTSLAVTFKQMEVETVSFTISSSEGGSLKQEIPVGSSTAYQIFPTENWKINTITFNGVDVTSELVDNQYTTPAITENSILSVVFVKSDEGIHTSMASQIKVYASQKNIIVKGTTVDTPIQIYSTSGQMIHSTRSGDDVTTIALAESGVYLIKIENNTYKVNL